jgi:hypothetical protein
MKLTAGVHLYPEDKITVHHGQGYTALKLSGDVCLFLSGRSVDEQLQLLDSLRAALLELEGNIRVRGKA